MVILSRGTDGGCVRLISRTYAISGSDCGWRSPPVLGGKGEFLAVRDPHELYEFATELPTDLGEPVLLQALTGFVDAGAATRIARDHLLSRPNSTVLCASTSTSCSTTDPAARPCSSSKTTGSPTKRNSRHPSPPGRAEHTLPDARRAGAGLPVGAVIAAVTSLVRRLGVRCTVGLTAIPMAVPHTRPLGLTAHGTRRDLIAGHRPWLQQVQVPASAGNLLEYRLGQAGPRCDRLRRTRPALPSSKRLSSGSRDAPDRGRARHRSVPAHRRPTRAAEQVRTAVDSQVAKASEIAAHVRTLEEQYDALMQSRHPQGLFDLTDLPTADELGADLERFLAEQSKPGDGPHT